MQDLVIRAAVPGDARALLKIYRPYVTDTAITFEYDVPDEAEFTHRIIHTLEKYPYLTAQREGEIVGYAYASPFKERAAYDWSVETSIYVDRHYMQRGIGGALHSALEKALIDMHVCNMNACISVPRDEDPYLDHNSEQFHAHLGYSLAGRFHCSGYKFGRWYDMIWMEKMIGPHAAKPKPVTAFDASAWMG